MLQGRHRYAEDFAEKKKVLNAIDSLSDLNDRKKFGEIFLGAHVFIDFDGVISDDETRRIEKTEIVFRALVNAAEKMGVSRDVIVKRIAGGLRGE